jgi:hypothetical protein
MNTAMRHVVSTDETGAQLTAEQLAEAGVKPGEHAVVEIRRYGEEEWIAEGEGHVLTTEEFVEHLRRAPSAE